MAGLLDVHPDAFPKRLPVHTCQTQVRIARAVLLDACLGLAEDFAFREILGGNQAAAFSDRENKGENKKDFGFHGIEEDTPGGGWELQKMRGLGNLRSASARDRHTPVRFTQVPRHLNAGPTLQADTHRTTDRLPKERSQLSSPVSCAMV